MVRSSEGGEVAEEMATTENGGSIGGEGGRRRGDFGRKFCRFLVRLRSLT